MNVGIILKGLGIDAEAITGQINDFGRLVADLHARQVRTEAKLDAIIAHLKVPYVEQGTVIEGSAGPASADRRPNGAH